MRPILALLMPRSIRGLVLIGFILVALPLIVSVVGSVFYVDELVRQSRQLVVEGMEVIRTSELLVEQISDMERNARQYQVLGESALLNLYQEKHELFRARVDLLEQLVPEGAAEQQFEIMRDNSASVLRMLHAQPVREDKLATPAQAEQVEKLIEHFTTLKTIAVGLANQSGYIIRQELQALFEMANKARLGLYWQSAALPIALLLGLLFTVLITRPVRQLSNAIRTLGEGGLDRIIAVAGPPELRDLGQQLDWLRRRLLESEQEKNQFLRHMSHELKTPLASVREGAELLADGTVGGLNENQSEVATIVRESSLELQLLIENLLNFSAWQERRSKPELERIILPALLQDLMHKYRLIIKAKQLMVRIPAQNIMFHADSSLLTAALDNLLSNAIKFTPLGGSIKILAAQVDRTVLIEVLDSGPGISAADRDLLFEPFYKGKTPLGTQLRGSGIGLSVARECIQAHGGSIELLDESQGAHFRITLPNRRYDDKLH